MPSTRWTTLAARAALAFLCAAGIGVAAAQDVELFDKPNFTGVRLTLSDSAPDLGSFGLGDRVSSVVVHRGQWEFCTEPRFGGACITVGPGRYAQLPPGLRGSLASLREVGREPRPVPPPPPEPPRPGPPGQGPSVIVLFDDIFRGARLMLNDRVDDLRQQNFNDRTISVEITGGAAWDLCSDGGFGGDCIRLGAGRHLLPQNWQGRVSSVRPLGGGGGPGGPGGPGRPGGPADNVTVTLFNRPDFGGRELVLTGDTRNLEDQGFNDAASSVLIERGLWQLCANSNFRDPCVVLGRGRHVLRPPLANGVSSVRRVTGGPDDPRRGRRGITLYEQQNQRGDSLFADQALPNLRGHDFNDRARSVDVHGGSWQLCSAPGYRGQCIVFGPGEHTLPQGVGITSLRPVERR
jgi:hypothetical protein